MKNDSNPIIRSEEVTIDMHICAALSESRSSGEIYFAAIAPDMELTVITLDEAPDILPCFDEDDAYLNIPDSSLLLSYNPAQVLKLAGKHYLPVAVGLIQHINEVRIFKNIRYFGTCQQILHILC